MLSWVEWRLERRECGRDGRAQWSNDNAARRVLVVVCVVGQPPRARWLAGTEERRGLFAYRGRAEGVWGVWGARSFR